MHKRLFYSTSTHAHTHTHRHYTNVTTDRMSLLIEIDDNFSNVKVRMTTNDARFSVVVEHLAPGQTSTTGVEVGVPLSLGYDEGGGSCRNSDMHPTQRLSLFRYGSQRNGLEDFMRCLLYTSPSPRDRTRSRMPSSA